MIWASPYARGDGGERPRIPLAHIRRERVARSRSPQVRPRSFCARHHCNPAGHHRPTTRGENPKGAADDGFVL